MYTYLAIQIACSHHFTNHIRPILLWIDMPELGGYDWIVEIEDLEG
jgi:hypothetical protein